MEEKEEIKKEPVKQTNTNIILMTILIVIILVLTAIIINDKCEEPTRVIVPQSTPTPTATPEPETKKTKTIQDYVDEYKSKGDNVKLINNLNEITTNKTKLTTEEDMKEYARLLVNSNLELGLGIAKKEVKDATKNEILELILMIYVSSPDCVSQTVISQLADQLYDIKGFENKEYARYIDGYYCPGGLGGYTGEIIIKEEVSNEGDIYIYKFGIGSEEEVNKTIQVKFKKVNDQYKIVYFG